MLNVGTCIVGPIETNCFIAWDNATKEAAVIDPGDEADVILTAIKNLGVTVKYVFCTHGHFDHCQAVNEVCEATGAPFGIHSEDTIMVLEPERFAAGFGATVVPCRTPDISLHNGDIFTLGESQLEVIFTPGHTRGGCCFYDSKDQICFCGDTLFFRGYGRTDLIGGDLSQLVKSLKERMKVIHDDTIMYTGHGHETNMGIERKKQRIFRG